MKETPFRDEELRTIVEQKIRQAVGMYNSRLSKERETVLHYYNREYPKVQSARQSTYVSTTVYDSVESMKAQLLETFATGRDIVQFVPQNAKDVEASRIATEYVNFVVNRQNNAFNLYQTVIDDALKARVGIVKVYWDTSKDYTDHSFEGVPLEALEALSQADDVDRIEIGEPDPFDRTVSGVLTKIVDRSQVRIDTVAPEDFGIEQQATRLEGSFHFHRVLKTRAQIAAMGFSTKKLKDKQPDASAVDTQDIETYTRFEQVDTGYNPRDDKGSEQFWLYECYAYLERDERRALYKIVRVAGEILEVEEVDRSPFIVFTPLPVGHSFWGNNFAALSIPTQNATTVLHRGILDHTAIATNPRLMVVQGGLTNPKELTDNRLGGIVNVKSADSIVPMPQSSLNQYVFPALELLKANNEQTTGISSLSQGLNKDAVSNQNSQGLISDLVDLSMTRQKTIARNFAYGFLVPLFLEVYRLAVLNEDRSRIVEVAGNFVEVDPRTWIERRDCDIHIDLTGGDPEVKGMKLMTLLSTGAQNPVVAGMITPDNWYNAALTVMRSYGFKNGSDFITHPSKIPPKQPDPLMIKQAELAEMQAQAGMIAAQATMTKAQAEAEHKQHGDQLAELRLQLDAMTRQMDLMRKQLDVENRVEIAQRETALLEQQSQSAAGDVRGIISP